MPQKKHKKRIKLSRRTIITTSLVIVALVLAVSAGVVAQLLQRNLNKNITKSNFTTSDSGLPQAIDKAQNESLLGNSNSAQQTIQSALNAAETNVQKKQLYLQQGIVYENQQQYDQAITSYKKAEELGIDFTIALRIAESAEAKGDKSLAITYYKKAIANIDQKNPMRDADKQNLEEKIRSLGGQP